MLRRGLVIVGTIGIGLLAPSDGAACSCGPPQVRVLGPDRVNDAPLNARIRFEVPPPRPTPGAAIVRDSETGAKADVTERQWQEGSLFFVELTPSKPLAADTRYEVVFVSSEPNAYPSTTVLSTFKTGTAADTTPPKLDTVGAAIAKDNAQANGGDCSVRGPWIEIANVTASDPGRPNAQLMFGIWAADASGHLDTTKPPDALVAARRNIVTLGKRSLCDPHDFPIPPATPTMTIAIAAVDESGNMSPPRRLPKISLAGIGAHP